MLFRLQCSADRTGQLHNLYRALIVHFKQTAPTTGPVDALALLGMRTLSQRVFALFKQTYIDQQRNFLEEVNKVPARDFLGEAFFLRAFAASQDPQTEQSDDALSRRIASARNTVNMFVIYQLSNSNPPMGQGVGCGHYDEGGVADGKGIAKAMNDYLFGTCFNPDLHPDNVILFLDHCLSHLRHSYPSDTGTEGLFVSKAELPGGLDPSAMGRYWQQHGEHIRGRNLQSSERIVFTSNYTATYRQHLNGVFAVLDTLVGEAPTVDAEVTP